MVGKRTRETALAFMFDLGKRIDNRVQISSDALGVYLEAVQFGFGEHVDYATVVKSYEAEPIGPGRYSPPKVTGTVKSSLLGNPEEDLISTSFVERQNLTMRMCMRRLTRLTNGFSKKLENHKAATALHFANYNFCRNHLTLTEESGPRGKRIDTTPAMAAGITYQPWSIGDLLDAALA